MKEIMLTLATKNIYKNGRPDIKTAEIEYLERREYDNVNDDPHFDAGMVEIGSKTIVLH